MVCRGVTCRTFTRRTTLLRRHTAANMFHNQRNASFRICGDRSLDRMKSIERRFTPFLDAWRYVRPQRSEPDTTEVALRGEVRNARPTYSNVRRTSLQAQRKVRL